MLLIFFSWIIRARRRNKEFPVDFTCFALPYHLIRPRPVGRMPYITRLAAPNCYASRREVGKTNMKSEAQALAYTANFATAAFKILVECLEKNGALHQGQFQRTLRTTIGCPDAELHRLDYVLLSELLNRLDERVSRYGPAPRMSQSEANFVPVRMCTSRKRSA